MRARWMAAVALLGGCDLVFPPGAGPKDAPASRVDGAPDPVEIDADPSLPDGAPDAEPPCAFTCYAADLNLGVPNPANPGTAACETVADDLCAMHSELLAIDLCTCSTGQLPELYVEVNGNEALVALFAMPGVNWSMIVNGGGCLGGGAPCTTDGPCQSGAFLFVWSQVLVNPGALNRFDFYQDVGSGCELISYVFTIQL